MSAARDRRQRKRASLQRFRARERSGRHFYRIELACIADDAQGESLRAVIDSEIDVRLVRDDLWQQIGREGSDDPKVLAAHVRGRLEGKGFCG